MNRRQIAKLALWALLLAQLSALPLSQWLGLSVCTMGCASEGRECCCESLEAAPAHGDRSGHANHAGHENHADHGSHGVHGHHPASQDLPRFSRPAEACAPECSGVLEGPRQNLRVSLDVVAGNLRPPTEGPALVSQETAPTRGGRYNPAIGPRAPPFLSPVRI